MFPMLRKGDHLVCCRNNFAITEEEFEVSSVVYQGLAEFQLCNSQKV